MPLAIVFVIMFLMKILDDAGRAAIERWFAARPPPPTDANAGIVRGANLLMIQAEAMQGWVIGATHNGQEITPFLNKLRERALVYTALADESAQGMTSDAEYAALNSQLPLGQGAVAFLRADNHFHTLAHALHDAGPRHHARRRTLPRATPDDERRVPPDTVWRRDNGGSLRA